MNDWNTNQEKIRTLFPLADFNREIVGLFAKRMMKLNQDYLADAIDQVKATHVVFKDNPPELKWFLDAYSSIEVNRRNVNGVYKQPEKFFVDYETKSQHGDYMLGATTEAPDLATAQRIARERGGRIRSNTQVCDAVNDSDLLQHIKSTPRQEISDAIATLRRKGMIQQDPLPADVSKWSKACIGRVSAQLELNKKGASCYKK